MLRSIRTTAGSFAGCRSVRKAYFTLRRALQIAAVSAFAGALIGCSNPDTRFDRIVFVSIDTLRADHLGAYGYPRPVSPFLDQLADGGSVFERAYASMSTTGPSHATMLTGLHPIQHGVMRNGHRLADEWTTLAEILSARQFSTAGFSGTRAHFRAGNLDQGFAHFEEPDDSVPRALYQPADRTLNAARAWLQTQPNDRPLFLLLHLFDVHHPWNPPESDLRAVKQGAEEVGFEASYWKQVQHVPLDFYSRVEQMRSTIDSYDAEIHFVDRELRRFASDFDAWAEGGTTLWIVTSDHGEGLGNHHWMFHGKHIYDEQVRVPLIVYATDGRFADRRFDEVVRHVDLLPTILDLTTPSNESAAAENANPVEVAPRAGRSLAGLLRGTRESREPMRSAFIQRRSFDPNPAADERAMRGEVRPDNRYEAGDTYAWIEDRWKLIHRTIGRDELFDLEHDRYETKDLSLQQPERLQQMRAALEERLAELKSVVPRVARPVEREAREQLEALGYLP